MWQPHQRVLRQLIKYLTGKTAEEKLKEDVYHVFLDVFYFHFDGVSREEIQDVLNHLVMLQLHFHEEYLRALKTYTLQTGQLPPGVRER